MPESKYIKLKVLFVSVDPDRDTPEKIKNYLKSFGNNIIGISGSNNEDMDLKDCMKTFKIYANKIVRSE
jgi:protein SCO1/2